MIKLRVMKAILFVVSLFLVNMGCEKGSDATVSEFTHDKDIILNDTIYIGYGQCISDFEKQDAICFDSVLSDSRCPEDVVCVWAGEAIVRFRFEIHGHAPVLVNLHVETPDHDTIVYGYKLTLFDLLPHPNTKNETLPVNYRARILVTRGE